MIATGRSGSSTRTGGDSSARPEVVQDLLGRIRSGELTGVEHETRIGDIKDCEPLTCRQADR